MKESANAWLSIVDGYEGHSTDLNATRAEAVETIMGVLDQCEEDPELIHRALLALSANNFESLEGSRNTWWLEVQEVPLPYNIKTNLRTP